MNTTTETLEVGTPVITADTMRTGRVVAVDAERGYQVRTDATPDVAHWYDAAELFPRGEVVHVRDLAVGDVVAVPRRYGMPDHAEVVEISSYERTDDYELFEVILRTYMPRERFVWGASRSVVRGAR